MKAVVRKEKVLLKTYPYSDPAPVPEFGRLYPYNRFDGYTGQGEDTFWEMIILENDFIKVWINPAVGGKVWGAIEKSTGKEFIYFNKTAKFRDVAMRGPWTSGGLEFNVGIIGHSPSCSAAVDHYTRTNDDGSVSCFIGATDWPSRTRWFVEIMLHSDAACFVTRTSWLNSSREEQSYYNWSNAGIKTAGDLEYVFPGSAYLGHDGKSYTWPVDAKGRDLSWYENNDFGHYKSYHITGTYAGFWGCYWHADNFGMGHYAAYDAKPGKKIWIWGLSRYGMLWEDLLTDSDGQYTEVQSGRMFNQSISRSSRTPFKHRSFVPGTFDTWDEYWFPVKDTGGLDYTCPELSFYISEEEDKYELRLCANQSLQYMLKLEDQKGILITAHLAMSTLENKVITLVRAPESSSVKLWLDDVLIYDACEQNKPLKRPQELAGDYDHDSVEGLYLQGKEWERQRFFTWAVEKYQECLQKDPYHIKALTGLAGLRLRCMNYTECLELLLKALSVDSYDGEANYLYGLVNNRLKNNTDAKDGFSIATQSVAYRSAAYTELAGISIRENQLAKADAYLLKALECNTRNSQAIRMQIYIKRRTGKADEAVKLAHQQLQADPLDHLPAFELYRAKGSSNAPLFTERISSELPYETYIELASFYTGIDAWADAMAVLELSPRYAITELWKACVSYRLGNHELSVELINKALHMNPAFVFPHRYEDMEILQWASELNSGWTLKYYLSLVFLQTMREEEAAALLESCDNNPLFYPFYLVRAQLRKVKNPEGCEADLIRACSIAPEEWRSYMQLSKHYSESGEWHEALSTARIGYAANPANYFLGLQLARCLMYTEQFEEGIALMQQLNVLPNEGASEGRNVWRETNLYAALNAMRDNNWQLAVKYIDAARTWPENIGVGKPYDVDERLEDYLEMYCLQKDGSNAEPLASAITCYREKYPDTPFGSNDLLSILVFMSNGAGEKASKYMERWMDKERGTLQARWSQAFLKGDGDELAMLSAEKVILPVALPYEIPYEDREFPFIKQLYYMNVIKTQL